MRHKFSKVFATVTLYSNTRALTILKALTFEIFFLFFLWQPWSLDNESPRLQEAEKKKYYELRKERCVCV